MRETDRARKSRETEFVRMSIRNLTEEMREKHRDDGQAIAAASGTFEALRKLHPDCVITVAEISELLDAMLWRDQKETGDADGGETEQKEMP